ncbi:MAG: hypothetical protein NC434_05970 [Ruminococcus sp.]|nr:hypothetical protein [Ruminococcus sp.]
MNLRTGVSRGPLRTGREVGVQIVTVAELFPEDEGLRYAMQGLYTSMAHNFIVNHRSNVMRGLN